VFYGDPATPRKRAHPPHPIFGPCLLWPNNWMDQDATWYGGKLPPRRRCVRWGRSSPLKGTQPPVFDSCLLWPNGSMDEDVTWYGSRPRPRPHCIRRGASSPRTGAQQPPLFGPCLLWPRSPISATAELLFGIYFLQSRFLHTIFYFNEVAFSCKYKFVTLLANMSLLKYKCVRYKSAA